MYAEKSRVPGSVIAALAVALLAPASSQAATADLAVSTTDSPDPIVEGAAAHVHGHDREPRARDRKRGRREERAVEPRQFVSASASQGTCELTGKTVRCSLGMVLVGDVVMTVKVIPKKPGEIPNRTSGRLRESDTDPVASNNLHIETTTVTEAGGAGGGGGGPTCSGEAVTQLGTAGADTLVGTPGRDVIKARAGKDVVRGLQGRDVVCAGGGGDTVRGGSGNDRLKGGSGRDLLKGAGGADDLIGGPGRDVCKGGPGRDLERSC